MLMVKSMPPLMGVGVGLTGLALMLFPGGLNLLMVRVTLKLHLVCCNCGRFPHLGRDPYWRKMELQCHYPTVLGRMGISCPCFGNGIWRFCLAN